MKTAVAIGGVSALAACAEREEEPSVASDDTKYSQGSADLSDVPDRQHAWGQYLPRNRQNQIVFPQHQVFVFLEYVQDEPPADDTRERVEQSFRTLERAFQRGAGTEGRPLVTEGLLFSIAYSHSYFDVFNIELPDSAGLMRPSALLEELGSDPSLAAEYDAVLHLGSDVAEIVLAAEEALFGGIDTVNGITVEADLGDVFEQQERRSGIVGSGLPAEKLDHSVSSKSPVPMGFKSAFDDTLPSEDNVTIREGPFAGGTTQHVSLLVEDLDAWYAQEHSDRIEKMFGPSFTGEEVGEAGEQLGNLSEVTRKKADSVSKAAEDHGRVGHSQKLARARDDNFDPIILRRGDFFQSGDDETVLHFGSLQRKLDDFVRTRRAMDDLGFDGDDDSVSVESSENGLLDYIETKSRSTFLMPPRRLRSLPQPRPS